MDTSAVDGLVVYTCRECASNQDEQTVAMATGAVDSLIVYMCRK